MAMGWAEEVHAMMQDRTQGFIQNAGKRIDEIKAVCADTDEALEQVNAHGEEVRGLLEGLTHHLHDKYGEIQRFVADSVEAQAGEADECMEATSGDAATA